MTRFIRTILIALVVCMTFCMISCTKESIIGFANAVMTSVGDNLLTKSRDLTGTRKFGEDAYTGEYAAAYDNATMTEILFGNTSLMRREGTTVHVTAQIDTDEGSGALILIQGDEEPEILLENGTLDTDITIDPGQQYVLFECKDFTGDLDLNIA